jgi:hypothetical protein
MYIHITEFIYTRSIYKYILDTNEHSHGIESGGCNNNDKRTCKPKLRSDILTTNK